MTRGPEPEVGSVRTGEAWAPDVTFHSGMLHHTADLATGQVCQGTVFLRNLATGQVCQRTMFLRNLECLKVCQGTQNFTETLNVWRFARVLNIPQKPWMFEDLPGYSTFNRNLECLKVCQGTQHSTETWNVWRFARVLNIQQKPGRTLHVFTRPWHHYVLWFPPQNLLYY